MNHFDDTSESDMTSHPTAMATRPLTPEQCALVERHYPQVRTVVSQMRTYLPTCADLDELHSVGLTGLIAAVRRFNPDQTKTFEAYAAMRIRGAILDELRRLDWMPRSARHRARELRKTMDSLEQNLGRVPTPEETRESLGLNRMDFDKLQLRIQPVRFLPLDRPIERDQGAGAMLNLHECIADENTPPTHAHMEQEESLVTLASTMKLLPDRHRQVIMLYYFHGRRLSEIAEAFKVTEARICQIHGQALQLLRQRWVDRN
ncbi:MAG TPA: FliA/WhiG family RNA polymerase sigma factor [Opitutales bacterium]|nr:FliA/WhiG family RNA polymerase sigma factor [Opitutales bacterium]